MTSKDWVLMIHVMLGRGVQEVGATCGLVYPNMHCSTTLAITSISSCSRACCLFPQNPHLRPIFLIYHTTNSFLYPSSRLLLKCIRGNRFLSWTRYNDPPAEFYPMGQVYSALTRPVTTIRASLPWEVVSDGIRVKTQTWVCPPGGEQARPACFGDGELRIPDHLKKDRLCSVCMSLSRLKTTHWDSINNFHEARYSSSAGEEGAKKGGEKAGEAAPIYASQRGQPSVGAAGQGEVRRSRGALLAGARRVREKAGEATPTYAGLP